MMPMLKKKQGTCLIQQDLEAELSCLLRTPLVPVKCLKVSDHRDGLYQRFIILLLDGSALMCFTAKECRVFIRSYSAKNDDSNTIPFFYDVVERREKKLQNIR